MIRTQVYLTEDIQHKVRLAALREKKGQAQIIREALEEGLAHKMPAQNAGDALLSLAELGKKLNVHLEPDFSAKIDDYLYGEHK